MDGGNHSIPFYAGIASGDIVYAEYDEQEGFLTFQKVKEFSGNSTIQTVVLDDHAAIKEIRDIFNTLGCESEQLNEKYS